MSYLRKIQMTLTNTTVGKTVCSATDVNGFLLAYRLTNVTMTSDVVIRIFRTTGTTAAANRIQKFRIPTGSTSVTYRPIFSGIRGGTTNTNIILYSTNLANAIRMEFIDEKVLVKLSSAEKSTACSGSLTLMFG